MKNTLQIIVCIILFFSGVKVFNHSAHPWLGLLLAFAYPCVWLWTIWYGKDKS